MSENAFNKLQIIAIFEEKLFSKSSTGVALPDWTTDQSLLNDEEALYRKLEELAAGFKKAMNKDQGESNQLQDKLNLLYERAALSGRFDPSDLIAAIPDKDEKQQLLSILSKDVYVEATDKIQWLLNQPKRKEIVAQLSLAGKMDTALNNTLPDTDETGQMLRRIIRKGDTINIAALTETEKHAALAALEMLDGIDIPKPARESITSIQQQTSAIDTYPFNEASFVGRDEQLVQLYDFLESSNPVAGSWDGLVLYGLGGVGKSTLLAKFITDVIKHHTATTVILDFDRPGVDPNDSSWLEREISRQTGKQYPEFAETLSQLRKALKENPDNNLLDVESFYQSHEGKRQNKRLISEIKDLLLSSTSGNLPFLLVLDTVEEAAQRYLIGVLQEWLMYLNDLLYPLQLKVIFSGRLFNDHLQKIQNIHEVRAHIELTAFDTPSALAFLNKNGISTTDAEKIVDSAVIPLRPLELKLLADLVRKEPVGLDELLKELGGSGAGDQQKMKEGMFTGLIYRRVLMRISDPEIRKLAYPGLILRYLTPQIILDILSPVLELKIKNVDEAKKILDSLANYSWLCTIEKNGEVWHRRDMRHSMLQIMTAKEPALVTKIRNAALTYFKANENTPGFKAEYFYHLLMKEDRPVEAGLISKNELKKMAPELVRDIDDMPAPAAVLLKHAAGITLKDDELLLLPPAEFREIYHASQERILISRRFMLSYALYQRYNSTVKDIGNREKELSSTEHDMLYSLVEWQQIKYPIKEKPGNTKRSPFIQLSNYLFPYFFIRPVNWDRTFTDEMLQEGLNRSNTIGQFNEENGGVFFRISHALAMLDSSSGIPRETKKRLKELVSAMDKSRLTVFAERSRLLLYLISYEEWPEYYHLSTPLMKLDTAWLQTIIDLERPGASPLPGMLQKQLTEINQSGRYSSKLLLSTVDSLQVQNPEHRRVPLHFARLQDQKMRDMAAGPDLLFRDPCRYAILEAAATPEAYKRLAGIFKTCIPFKLNDLEPELFAAGIAANREFTLEPFIELADRCWNMGKLLSLLNLEFPNSVKIELVNKAFKQWKHTFELMG